MTYLKEIWRKLKNNGINPEGLGRPPDCFKCDTAFSLIDFDARSRYLRWKCPNCNSEFSSPLGKRP
jgi:PHP family Zn ribbon phosphoesterase